MLPLVQPKKLLFLSPLFYFINFLHSVESFFECTRKWAAYIVQVYNFLTYLSIYLKITTVNLLFPPLLLIFWNFSTACTICTVFSFLRNWCAYLFETSFFITSNNFLTSYLESFVLSPPPFRMNEIFLTYYMPVDFIELLLLFESFLKKCLMEATLRKRSI